MRVDGRTRGLPVVDAAVQRGSISASQLAARSVALTQLRLQAENSLGHVSLAVSGLVDSVTATCAHASTYPLPLVCKVQPHTLISKCDFTSIE